MRRPTVRAVQRDAGFVSAVEVVYLAVAALVAIAHAADQLVAQPSTSVPSKTRLER